MQDIISVEDIITAASAVARANQRLARANAPVHQARAEAAAEGARRRLAIAAAEAAIAVWAVDNGTDAAKAEALLGRPDVRVNGPDGVIIYLLSAKEQADQEVRRLNKAGVYAEPLV